MDLNKAYENCPASYAAMEALLEKLKQNIGKLIEERRHLLQLRETLMGIPQKNDSDGIVEMLAKLQHLETNDKGLTLAAKSKAFVSELKNIKTRLSIDNTQYKKQLCTPAITIYNVSQCKEIFKLLNYLVGEDGFELELSPKNIVTVLLLKMENLDDARNCLFKNKGYKLKTHSLEMKTPEGPKSKRKKRTYQRALTLYGAKFGKVSNILKQAVSPGDFMLDTDKENVVGVHLWNPADFENVRSALLERNYNIHTSDALRNVEGGKAALPETKSVFVYISYDAKNKGKPIEDFQPAFTLYDTKCKKVRNLLLGLVCVNDFLLEMKSSDCVIIKLLQMENVKKLYNVFSERGYTFDTHVADEVVSRKEPSAEQNEINAADAEKTPSAVTCNDEEEKKLKCVSCQGSGFISETFEVSKAKEANTICTSSKKFENSPPTLIESLSVPFGTEQVSSKKPGSNLLEACTRRYGENFLETFTLLRQFAPEFNTISREKGEDEAMKALQYKLLNVDLE